MCAVEGKLHFSLSVLCSLCTEGSLYYMTPNPHVISSTPLGRLSTSYSMFHKTVSDIPKVMRVEVTAGHSSSSTL